MGEPENPPRRRILVIATEPAALRPLLGEMELRDYDIHVSEPEQVMELVEQRGRFTLVLVSAGLTLDGLHHLERVLSHPDLRSAPIVACATVEEGLDLAVVDQLGGDDVVDLSTPVRVAADRLELLVRRSVRLLETSPLTGLPGNTVIRRRLAERARGSSRFAVIHADIDHFKSYNDHYGFLRGDALIGFCVRCLRQAQQATVVDSFLGHIGGDDFVVLIAADHAAAFCSSVIDLWDAGVATFYDQADRERGAIVATDRRGNRQRYPIVTLSLGVANNVRRPFKSPEEAVALAAEMKEYAKSRPGSNFRVDRRS